MVTETHGSTVTFVISLHALDMDDHVIDPDIVLKNHGGAFNQDFAIIVNEGSDSDEVELISYSPY